MTQTSSENLKNSTNADDIRQTDFNFLLPAVQSIELPRDAQIQIDAALTEMEAMDYRDWVFSCSIDSVFFVIFLNKIILYFNICRITTLWNVKDYTQF